MGWRPLKNSNDITAFLQLHTSIHRIDGAEALSCAPNKHITKEMPSAGGPAEVAYSTVAAVPQDRRLTCCALLLQALLLRLPAQHSTIQQVGRLTPGTVRCECHTRSLWHYGHGQTGSTTAVLCPRRSAQSHGHQIERKVSLGMFVFPGSPCSKSLSRGTAPVPTCALH